MSGSVATGKLIPEVIAEGVRISLEQAIYLTRQRIKKEISAAGLLDTDIEAVVDSLCDKALDGLHDDTFWRLMNGESKTEKTT